MLELSRVPFSSASWPHINKSKPSHINRSVLSRSLELNTCAQNGTVGPFSMVRKASYKVAWRFAPLHNAQPQLRMKYEIRDTRTSRFVLPSGRPFLRRKY